MSTEPVGPSGPTPASLLREDVSIAHAMIQQASLNLAGTARLPRLSELRHDPILRDLVHDSAQAFRYALSVSIQAGTGEDSVARACGLSVMELRQLLFIVNK